MSGFDRRRVTDKTDLEVKATAEVMKSQPHCTGVLYGTHCTQAHLVPIPFIKQYTPNANRLPPPASVDTLFIECWMPRGMKQKWEDRLTIRAPPCADNNVDHIYMEEGDDDEEEEEAEEDSESYTIFYAPQSQKRDPFSSPEKRNAAIANILYDEEERGRRGREIVWYGPLLVIKHSTEEMSPISVTEEELGAIWGVVKGALRNGTMRPSN